MNPSVGRLIDSTSNTVDIATEIIKTFADKLGVSVNVVWKALCAKTVVEGYWEATVFGFISLVFLVSMLLSLSRTIIKVKNEGWGEPAWGNVIITVVLALFLLGSTSLVKDGLTRIYIPEYHAAIDIYEMWNNYVNPPRQ